MGFPLKDDMVGYLEDVRKGRRRSSTRRGFDAAWPVTVVVPVLGLVCLENGNKWR